MRLSVLFVVAAAMMSGCAHFKSAGENKSADEKPEAPRIGETALPPASGEGKLSSQVLYQYLLAEIAGQRGEFGLSAKAYLDLAAQTRDPRLARRATEIALYAKQTEVALEAASLWLELEPGSAQARQSVAALLVNSDDLAAAKSHLERLLQAEGGHGFLQLNNLLARHQDKKAVLELVRGLATPYPESAEAQFALAQAAANADRMDLAIPAGREALKLRPGWGLAAVSYSQLLARSGDSEGALRLLEDFLKTNKQAAEVRLHYARALVAEKRYGAARAEFDKLMRDFPDNADVALAVGLLSLQLRDYGAAEAQLKKTLELGHREPDTVRIYLGQASEERKDYEEAKKWYASVSRGKQFLEAHIRYAGVLAKEGKLSEARQHVAALPAQNPQERIQLIQAEAQLLRESTAFEEAFAFLSRALERIPNQPDLLYDRAMAAEKLDRLDVLEDDLRKLIQLKPDNAHAYNALGFTFADRNQRLDEAQQLIERALKLAPEDPFILDSMGWVKYRRGDLKESLSYLRRAYSERPDPEIAAHLSEVLWTAGSRQEAEKVLRGSLEEHPENAALQSAAKKFLSP